MLWVHTYAWVGIESLKIGGVDSLNLRLKVPQLASFGRDFPVNYIVVNSVYSVPSIS